MKRSIFIFFLLALSAQQAFTQIDFSKYSTTYLGKGDRPAGLPSLMTARASVNDAFWPGGFNGAEPAQVDDPAFYQHRAKQFYSTATFDSTPVQFFAIDIDPQNAGLYEYRVIQNDKTVITPWSTISRFTDKGNTVGGGSDPMGYLGAYKTTEGGSLIVDLRKKGTDSVFAYTVVHHRSVKPRIADIFLPNELNLFLNRLSNRWSRRVTDMGVNRWSPRYPASEIDPSTSFPKKLELSPTENSLIFHLNVNIEHKEEVEYELVKDGATFVAWKPNDFDNGFIWLQQLTPGDYVLKIRYSIQRHHVTTYPFRIKPAWHQTALFKIIAGSLIAAFFGFILLLFRLRAQKRKMHEEASRKAKLQLELKAIRSQLNPHFIFNALNSIQGLINKNDISAANRYLSEFGNLVRHALIGTDKDLTTLHEEVTQLGTYLKLEQLRFGFHTNIGIDVRINAYTTELPSLLLQPLVENAVKHGISGMQENGHIAIHFLKENNDMIASIWNNGQGFTNQPSAQGYGLKLTGERITLLNKVLKDQSIQWTIDTQDAGTVVKIIFKNWLA